MTYYIQNENFLCRQLSKWIVSRLSSKWMVYSLSSKWLVLSLLSKRILCLKRINKYRLIFCVFAKVFFVHHKTILRTHQFFFIFLKTIKSNLELCSMLVYLQTFKSEQLCTISTPQVIF